MSGGSPSRPLSQVDSQPSFVVDGSETLSVPGSAAELLGIPQLHIYEASSSTLVPVFDNGVPKVVPSSDNAPYENDCPVAGDEAEKLELEERANRPFYKRPSAWWMLCMVSAAAIASTTTIAPRIEIFTKLACEALRPEYTALAVNELGIMQIVPPPSQECIQDGEVQAAVAQLMTIMTVSMGILSCLSTGWWGQLSDRYGRLPIIRIAACGLLITDANFILVTLAAKRLPGGYRFMLVGPIIDGFFGGMITLMAGIHAYISDSTSPTARARVFSLNLGLLFGGMAIGPTLGSFMIRATNNLLSVFYLATGAHVLYTLMAMFIIPESLTHASMRKARKRREALQVEAEAALVHLKTQPRATVIRARIWRYLQQPFIFITPMRIFLPFKRPGGGWDINLTLLVLASSFEGLLTGAYQFTFQYAQMAFGWNSEVLGYWLSVVSVLRSIYLILLLPFVMKIFAPKTAPIQLPTSPSEPLHPAQSASTDDSHLTKNPVVSKHSASFDLGVARTSVIIELLCTIGMIASTSSLSWSAASAMRAFASGFAPALQSVALALYEKGPNGGAETGRLFGGLSVVQALSHQIIGPSLFGLTYTSTVNVFPKAIFVLAASILACAGVTIMLVQVPKTPPKTGHDREETTVEGGQLSHE